MSIPPNPANWPAWYNGKTINESLFCQEYLATHQLLYTEQAFFTPNGRMTDETPLKESIFELIRPYAMTNVTKKIGSIIDLLKITAHQASFPPMTNRVHLQNGTLFLDGRFLEGRPAIIRSRFPVKYNPDAPQPMTWLRFLLRAAFPG